MDPGRDRWSVIRRAEGWEHMLLLIGVLITLIAAVIVPRVRVPGGVSSHKLGSMSGEWLVEHRASHSS